MRKVIFVQLMILLLMNACKQKQETSNKKVEVKKENGKYILYRNGQPYFIQGAGTYTNFEKLKECGGNSVRTWNADSAQKILDEAEKLGLTVTLGIYMGNERHGFDYNDSKAVAAQFENIKKEVIKYKDHPALLMWGIGNELDIISANEKAKNLKVWDAVNDIAKMIHEVDGNHPVTTMIVPYRKTIWDIKRKCPELDVLSINTFGELSTLSEKLNELVTGWNGPYVVSEWGTQGWWEAEQTAWEVPIEPTSSKKAEFYLQRYEEAIRKDTLKCLGSYVFYWGQKQEKTSTWFSMFLPSGEETEAIDVMQYLWSNKWPANSCPKIDHMLVNNKGARDNIFLRPNALCRGLVKASDKDNDSLQIRWEIMPDVYNFKGGGDEEKALQPLKESILIEKNHEVTFRVPEKEGPYRIFVYVSDGKNNAATANTPFYVVK